MVGTARTELVQSGMVAVGRDGRFITDQRCARSNAAPNRYDVKEGPRPLMSWLTPQE